MKLYLENILKNDIDISYDNLPVWTQFDAVTFSKNKKLYNYQQEAIKRVSQILHLFFNGNQSDPISNKIKELYETHGFNFDEGFPGQNINRTAFWMATGSGKSIVLIKTIELLDWAMKKSLIPKKEIMLLLPREDLITQFRKEVEEYNRFRGIGNGQINLVSLKDYEDHKRVMSFLNEIKVYYYRSDLLRDENKQTILDYKNYLNNGNWYVFLDEAHRGIEKTLEQSKMKQNIAELSKNGFLFNFSATFTEEIDYATCCYNFNLEKFITSGYGKNIYLSQSLLNFRKSKADLEKSERQLQILKSIIVFCLVKNVKDKNTYHNPLMVTYVNSVNVREADLKLFFKEIVNIAKGNINSLLLKKAKEEILSEFGSEYGTEYIFKKDNLKLNEKEISYIQNFTDKEILKHFFNASTPSNIQWQKGESGKEIMLKLVSSTKYFALIRIGDADLFSKELLTNEYEEISSFIKSVQFKKLNDVDNSINLLMGSRSFYEGWDSNRPNVINLINIGGKDAKKFVPQAIGRGIRIQPYQADTSNRRRLPDGNKDKSKLLETLFVFATDKNSINLIMDEIDRSSSTLGIVEKSISHLFKKRNPEFTLLIPTYKKITSGRSVFAKFACSKESQDKIKKLLNGMSKINLIINYDITESQCFDLIENVNNGNIFQNKDDLEHANTEYLLEALINHMKEFEREVERLKELDDEINHFEKISVEIGDVLNEDDLKILENKIQSVANFKNISFSEWKETKAVYNELSEEEQNMLYEKQSGKSEEIFKHNITILNLIKHYYFPLILSSDEKIDYIKHIIKVDSEVRFINNLNNFLKIKKEFQSQWMFSKINEMNDLKMGIPYFDKETNAFKKFYPDFIFWVKNDSNYDIYYIDPKGTKHASWQSKVDYFNKIFEESPKKPKTFKFENMNVRFHLRLLTDDINKVDGTAYADYWHNINDFDFLK